MLPCHRHQSTNLWHNSYGLRKLHIHNTVPSSSHTYKETDADSHTTHVIPSRMAALLVTPHNCRRWCRIVTEAAFMRFLPCVSPLMNHKSAEYSCWEGAVLALVRLLHDVVPEVHLEVVSCCRGVRAVAAPVRSLACMRSLVDAYPARGVSSVWTVPAAILNERLAIDLVVVWVRIHHSTQIWKQCCLRGQWLCPQKWWKQQFLLVIEARHASAKVTGRRRWKSNNTVCRRSPRRACNQNWAPSTFQA